MKEKSDCSIPGKVLHVWHNVANQGKINIELAQFILMISIELGVVIVNFM